VAGAFLIWLYAKSGKKWLENPYLPSIYRTCKGT
jgi:hypothetical protein